MGRLLTADPQFARATVNLFWARLMGFGIVEPFDEFDLARLDPKHLPAGWQLQASHPELLEKLAADFRSSGYSLRHLLATICRSNAYQLSARFEGEWKERLHQILRPQVRSHAGRRGVARFDRAGHQPPRTRSPRAVKS